MNLKLRRHCGEHLDFRPLLSPDFWINIALGGGNPVTKAVATAPTVPNFPSASLLFVIFFSASYIVSLIEAT
ncbi:hypothetical protein HQN87_01670 [Paenibacillus tritici]|uniref:Uncharacterized protein n=1 Tax=Paenibacillus tritici TaxID=1873425 RepID=A0ABX2DHE0_9BACL|nr:hypothetical protein [Paenibacillus tritici]NQX44025.1 hypothetical protein [Paenibacillus tritici]